MGAGHSHGAELGAGAKYRHRLWAAFGLLLALLVVEFAVGLFSNSLALLSDAGHMFTDVLAIGMALAAIYAARRASADPQRTFGLYRLEVLAALANAVLLAAVAIWVLVEAIRRFSAPVEVLAGPMLVVAVAGLVANLVAFGLLRSGASESLNVRGAYLEVLGDTLGSIGVIVAAVIIALTGWTWADPAVAVGVGVFILPRTWRLAKEAIRILTQSAPKGIDVEAVERDLSQLDRVIDVHDVHVWTLTSGMDVASAHLTVAGDSDVAGVLTAANDRLRMDYGIDHATLQVEPVGTRPDCGKLGW